MRKRRTPFHCVECMESLGLVRGSGTHWAENCQSAECKQIKLCEIGFKKIADVSKVMVTSFGLSGVIKC